MKHLTITLLLTLLVSGGLWADGVETKTINLICIGKNLTVCPPSGESCGTYSPSDIRKLNSQDDFSDVGVSITEYIGEAFVGGKLYTAKWGIFETDEVFENGNFLSSTWDADALGGDYVGTETVDYLNKVTLEYVRDWRNKTTKRSIKTRRYQCKETNSPFAD